MLGPLGDPLLTVGVTVGASVALLIDQAGGGVTPDLWTQLGVIGAGCAVFLYQEKRMRREAENASKMRREADAISNARIADLEARIDRLLTQHADEVQRLNERIIALLQQGRGNG